MGDLYITAAPAVRLGIMLLLQYRCTLWMRQRCSLSHHTSFVQGLRRLEILYCLAARTAPKMGESVMSLPLCLPEILLADGCPNN